MYFKPDELALIQRCAQEARHIDNMELTVAAVVHQKHESVFTPTQLRIIDFCAGECHRQKSRALSVHRMVVAYEYVSELVEPLGVEDVLRLGAIVEPVDNRYSFATVPAMFSTTDITQVRSPENIPRQVESLLTNGGNLSPLELYVFFEDIHPFNDGNGRLGAIFYNLRNGRLDNPLVPPRIDFRAFKENPYASVETFIITD